MPLLVFEAPIFTTVALLRPLDEQCTSNGRRATDGRTNEERGPEALGAHACRQGVVTVAIVEVASKARGEQEGAHGHG